MKEVSPMFDRFRYKFMQFMQGRYGADKFGQFLSGVILVLIVMDLILRMPLLWWLSLILLIYMYFRMFSRNIAKRYNENRKYLEITEKIRNSKFGCWFENLTRSLSARFQNFIWRMRNNSQQRRQNAGYHIYKCPQCGQKIRIPKGKGRIMVRCPKCGKEFKKRS